MASHPRASCVRADLAALVGTVAACIALAACPFIQLLTELPTSP